MTASAKAGSRIPAGFGARMQTFPGAAARSCPVPAVRRLPLLQMAAVQMPGKHRADAGCTSTATNTSSVSRRRQKPRNPRRNSRDQPKENQNGLPSWNLPLTSCHRRRRIKADPGEAQGRAYGKEAGGRRGASAFPEKLRMETASDPETGKAKKRLKFEQEVKSQRAHVKGSLPMRPVKAAANTAVGYAHKKIYQAEEENVGVKAAHRTELVGEAGVRTLYHRHKTAPYRRVTKLQQKSARANAQLAYRQALSDHPELKKISLPGCGRSKS